MGSVSNKSKDGFTPLTEFENHKNKRKREKSKTRNLQTKKKMRERR